MYKKIFLGLLMCLWFTSTISAQVETFTFEHYVPASYFNFGAGARALGMGGSFIAVADDATAVSWNPAGLAILDKIELSAIFFPSTQFHGTWDGVNHMSANGSYLQSPVQSTAFGRDWNFLSITFPFYRGTTNWVGQLSVQRIISYSFNQEVDNSVLATISTPDSFEQYVRWWNGRFRGGFDVATLGLAVGHGSWKFGIAVNYWWNGYSGYDDGTELVEISSGGHEETNSVFDTDTEDINLRGMNFHFGILWEPHRKVRVGAVIKTPFRGNYTFFEDRSIYVMHEEQSTVTHIHEDLSGKLDWPLSLGTGLAYYFTDTFLLSADITWTNWSQSKVLPANPDEEPRWYPSLKPLDAFTQQNQLQLRTGAEWVVFAGDIIIPLRGGLFLDRQPVPDAYGQTVWYRGWTLGIGVNTNHVMFDLALLTLSGSYVFDKETGAQAHIGGHAFIFSIIVIP